MAEVYVDPSAMADWKTSINRINNSCIDTLDDIETSLSQFRDSFQGEYADKYDESISGFIKKIKSSHESLKDVENFLNIIVETMQNQ